MDVFRAFAIITISALVVYIYKLFKTPKGFPPGPSLLTSSFTLIKTLSLRLNVYEVLHGWGKEFGPIFGINVGVVRIVVLDDYSSIRDGLKHPDFAHKFGQTAIRVTRFASDGIIFGQAGLRKFVVKNLKNLFAKRYVELESAIVNEVVDFTETCKDFEHQPIHIDKLFSLLSFNVALSFLAGADIPFQRKELLDTLNDLVQYMTESPITTVFISVFPKFTSTFPKLFGLAGLRNKHEIPSKLFHKIIQHHKETLQIDEQRDLIDAYLVESLKTTDQDSPFHADNYVSSLTTVLFELLGASSTTIPVVLTWATLFLAKHTDIQKKFQQEIDQRTNKSRLTNLADVEEMPFTQALIQEILRFSPIALSAGCAAAQDTNFKCHDIPKGTIILPNILGLHEDPKIWGDSRNFGPSRFLSEDGTKLISREELLPFGAGKRICPAINLAMNVLFLTLTNVFQNFNVELAPESKGVSTKHPFGFRLYPDFKVVMTKRNPSSDMKDNTTGVRINF